MTEKKKDSAFKLVLMIFGIIFSVVLVPGLILGIPVGGAVVALPYSVSQEGIAMVGTVLDVAQAPFLQKAFHVCPGAGQHGTDQSTMDRGDAAEALQAGAPYNMHQHCFGIVVCCVGGGDLAGKTAKESIPGIPGGGFQALFFGCHDAASHMERDIVAVT